MEKAGPVGFIPIFLLQEERRGNWHTLLCHPGSPSCSWPVGLRCPLWVCSRRGSSLSAAIQEAHKLRQPPSLPLPQPTVCTQAGISHSCLLPKDFSSRLAKPGSLDPLIIPGTEAGRQRGVQFIQGGGAVYTEPRYPLCSREDFVFSPWKLHFFITWGWGCVAISESITEPGSTRL